MDATQAWTRAVSDADELAGLSDSDMAMLQQYARQKDLNGWLITLEFPSYFAVMTFADKRELRQEVYTAFCTRASDQGPGDAKWDNAPVMEEILQLLINI